MLRRVVLAVLVLARARAPDDLLPRRRPRARSTTCRARAPSILRPFQVAAERVARPFRDAYGYFAGLARREVGEREAAPRGSRLARARRSRIARPRSRATSSQRLLQLRAGRRRYPTDYRPVNTTVISYPTSAFAQQVAIAAGSTRASASTRPSSRADGLVGRVTNVAASTRGRDAPHRSRQRGARDATSTTGVSGLIRHGQGDTLDLRPRVEGAEGQRRAT